MKAWGDGWAEGSPKFSIPTPHCVLTQSAGITPPLCFWSPENRGESESGWQDLRHSPPYVRPGHLTLGCLFGSPSSYPLGFPERHSPFFLIVVGLQSLLFPFLSAFCTGLFRICPQLAPYTPFPLPVLTWPSDFEHPLWIMPLPAFPYSSPFPLPSSSLPITSFLLLSSLPLPIPIPSLSLPLSPSFLPLLFLSTLSLPIRSACFLQFSSTPQSPGASHWERAKGLTRRLSGERHLSPTLMAQTKQASKLWCHAA